VAVDVFPCDVVVLLLLLAGFFVLVDSATLHCIAMVSVLTFMLSSECLFSVS